MPKEFIITLVTKDVMADLAPLLIAQIAENNWHTTKRITTRKQKNYGIFLFKSFKTK
jgi:hypothetical protein